MKVRNLKFWKPRFKISTRECDWSHQSLNWFDRAFLLFASVSWYRELNGRPQPIVKTKHYHYHFSTPGDDS